MLRTPAPSTRLVGWSVLAGLGACVAAGAAAQSPDLERGRLLYENHCVVCHTSKVHRRMPPLPIDMKDLRFIVSTWAKGQELHWTDEDVEDVVRYLDATHYRLLK